MADNTNGQLITSLVGDPNQKRLGAGAGGAAPPTFGLDDPSGGLSLGSGGANPPTLDQSSGSGSKDQNSGGGLPINAGSQGDANPPAQGWGTSSTASATGDPKAAVAPNPPASAPNPPPSLPNPPSWLDNSDYVQNALKNGGDVLGGAPSNSGSGSTSPDLPKVSSDRSPEQQALIDQLTARANQSTVIDPNDPNFKQQVDAFAAQQDRSRKQYLSDQAEGNSPYSTGQMANIERMTAEKAGQNVGQFSSQLVGQELKQRRDEIQAALTQLGGTLSDEQKNKLQAQVSNLDAAIQKAQMGQQNTQFFAGLNQQEQQFATQLTQNERFKNMDDALARYQVATQNGQFYAKLAQDGNIAQMQNELGKSSLAQQDKEFLLNLAQQGKYQDVEAAYKKAALAQDQNQFMAKLAQEGNIAGMDDLFRKMQLAQEESQFLDRLGFDTKQQQNYWDWKQRGNE